VISLQLQLFNYNAGKGDCIRLRFQGQSGKMRNLLIDSGVSRFGPRFGSVCAEISSAGERIDLLILTHVDEDHLGGLLYNMRLGTKLPIAKILMNFPAGIASRMSSGLSVRQNNELASRILAAGIPMDTALAGDSIVLDGAQIEILWPEKAVAESFFAPGMPPGTPPVPLSGRSDYGYSLEELMKMPIKDHDSSESNRRSIIFTFEYGHKTFLFTGDAWAPDILAAVGGRTFDLIKLPHHGSIRNLSEDWKSQLRCRNFLICTDGLQHPDKQTLAKLLKWNEEITVYGSVGWWNRGFLTRDDEKLLDKLHFIEGEEVKWEKFV